MFSLSELKKITFTKAKMGGYKAQEVDDFMTDITGDYADALSEINDLKNEVAELKEKIEAYRKDEESIKEAILTAQQLHKKTIRQAETEAENIKSEANNKVESLVENAKDKSMKMVSDAKNQASDILDSAKKESDEIIKSIKSQFEKEEKRLEVMKNMVGKFKTEMLNNYKEHIEMLQKLPDSVEEEPVEEEIKPSEEFYEDEIYEDISSKAEADSEPAEEESEPENDKPVSAQDKDIIAEVSGETIVFSVTDIKDNEDINTAFEDIDSSDEKSAKKTMAEKFAEIGDLNVDEDDKKKFGKKQKKHEPKKIIEDIKENADHIKNEIENEIAISAPQIEIVSYEADDDNADLQSEDDENYNDGFSINLDAIDEDEDAEENFRFFKGN